MNLHESSKERVGEWIRAINLLENNRLSGMFIVGALK
jgi:hypothetical protein